LFLNLNVRHPIPPPVEDPHWQRLNTNLQPLVAWPRARRPRAIKAAHPAIPPASRENWPVSGTETTFTA
jgi:hypothetical protein